MSRFRDDLAYGDDYYGGSQGERWDRERFERMRSRGPPARERESIRFEEDDYYRRGAERRDTKIEIDDRRSSGRDYYSRPPPEDRYRARPAYFEEDRYVAVDSREVAPYRARYEEPPPPPRYARPQMVRRQTSLDTFDRRPRPRYDEDEHDVNVNVRLTSPEAPRYVRREPEVYRDEDYRDVVIRREKHRDIYRRKRDSSSSSSSSSSEEIVVEKEKVKEEKVKKGKTRFPKRLCHLRAIAELGFPYTDEEYFYHVHVALKKELVDEVIEKSKVYFREESEREERTTLMIEAPAPPESPPASDHGRDESEVVETKTTRIIVNPTAEELERIQSQGEQEQRSGSTVRSSSPSRASRRGRSPSSRTVRSEHGRSEVILERDEEKESSLALVLPNREKSRSRREIDEEIRRLEQQKREIRRGGRNRDYEFEERDSVREKDVEFETPEGEARIRKGENGNLQFERRVHKRRSKSSRRHPTQRDVKAALVGIT